MEQFLVLPLGTFPATGEDQHCGVQAGGIGASCTFRNNDLDEYHCAVRRHSGPAVRQDSDRRVVVPVVNNPLQQVSVCTRWHGFSEVAGHLLGSTVMCRSMAPPGVSTTLGRS